MTMLCHIYLRNGAVYVPTVVRLESGAYMNVEPVAVVPAMNIKGLRRAFLNATAKENKVVPKPSKGAWPAPVLPKCAGVKTWRDFARGASAWNITETSGKYRIVGHRMHEKEYWVEDADQRLDFPPNTSVDAVIVRMIEILQEAQARGGIE
jgi:hypothetical protein